MTSMINRKPVPSIARSPPLVTDDDRIGNERRTSRPPYPLSPSEERSLGYGSPTAHGVPPSNNIESFDIVDLEEARGRARADSDVSSHGTWNTDPDDGDVVEVPKPLRIRASQEMSARTDKPAADDLPAILKPGGQSHSDHASPCLPAQQNEFGPHSNPWSEFSEILSPRKNSRETSHMHALASGQAFRPVAAPSSAPSHPPPPPPLPVQPAIQPPVELQSAPDEPPQSFSAEKRAASWNTAEVLDVPQKGQSPLPFDTSQSARQKQGPQSTWCADQTTDEPSGHGALPAPSPDAGISTGSTAPTPGPASSPRSPLGESGTATNVSSVPAVTGDTGRAARPHEFEIPQERIKLQKIQHYAIKYINWADHHGLRQSPILIQNKNGPCPLLALVNALVLSTPKDLNTALTETLGTREQVSLGLLLDAVFDELVSGRRGNTANVLPDVDELYSFLLALHTGMNVNPRFAAGTSESMGSSDGQSQDGNRAWSAGTFEQTKEMHLYSTFSVPLIHGWTAPVDTPAHQAFRRSAPTFEDAQNIQFAEFELVEKMRSQSLTTHEQNLLEDIEIVKSFLSSWPTQLTEHGLEFIDQSLEPGQIAILFRNDHFSTLYKEPERGALMTLVTDEGYSTHAEIVWESLADVKGAASELFSGDFRVVSHSQDSNPGRVHSSGGYTDRSTAQARPGQSTEVDSEQRRPFSHPPFSAQASSSAVGASDLYDLGFRNEDQRRAAEQEDHDLALALQLQEEEENHQHQAEERRRRERELSEQFISNDPEGPRPPIPPRRSGGRTGTGPTTAPSSRAPVTRPTDGSDDPDAPPTYEQSASDMPYRPAGATAPGTMAQGNPLGAYDALRRQQSAFAQQSSPTVSAPQSTGVGRGRHDGYRSTLRTSNTSSPNMPGTNNSQPAGRVQRAPGVKEAEDKCVVM